MFVFHVSGRAQASDTDPDHPMPREDLDPIGTKHRCGIAVCAARAVLIDARPRGERDNTATTCAWAGPTSHLHIVRNFSSFRQPWRSFSMFGDGCRSYSPSCAG